MSGVLKIATCVHTFLYIIRFLFFLFLLISNSTRKDLVALLETLMKILFQQIKYILFYYLCYLNYDFI
jgi:hypothetical protein